ncbi:MAG TPA: dihydrodipicolinate synthase family protein [Xanthobacteraceae bacterium]|nr:dihydrodipicolinate synthase family protein [Xanthobacteraceae bacterium]
MPPLVDLPGKNGRIERYRMRGPQPWNGGAADSKQVDADAAKVAHRFDRIAFAAAHVVADPLADGDPWLTPAIDWDATIAFRRYLWSLGLGVAEAMDTAQRGMGLDWPNALELIRRSVAASREVPGAVVFSGVGTDQLAPSPAVTLDDVIRAYEEQIEAVEACGGRIVLMASRALAAAAKSPDDYAKVYGRILDQVREPVIIHWLGEMFDPALAGYWGSADHSAAMDVCIDIIGDHADKVDGIKLSLLDKDKEIRLRRRLPQGVLTYTGDDFNFPELIAGDAQGFSHALLGIFAAIAPAAAAALDAHGRGDMDGYWRILEPTVPLSRHLFKAPTRFYKTGIVFLAYLNGHQSHFVMVGGQQSARSLLHLVDAFKLADAAGLIRDPDRAAARLNTVLRLHGAG